jgi:hypothetical protein
VPYIAKANDQANIVKTNMEKTNIRGRLIITQKPILYMNTKIIWL